MKLFDIRHQLKSLDDDALAGRRRRYAGILKLVEVSPPILTGLLFFMPVGGVLLGLPLVLSLTAYALVVGGTVACHKAAKSHLFQTEQEMQTRAQASARALTQSQPLASVPMPSVALDFREGTFAPVAVRTLKLTSPAAAPQSQRMLS